MKCSFALEYWIDDAWYVGRLREVAGVCSQGKSLAELEKNIRDAYRMMKKTSRHSKLSKQQDELLEQYDFDYRKAKPNRFAGRVGKNSDVTVRSRPTKKK